MRASKSELSKAVDTAEMTMFDGVWGDMHVEYDVFKKRFDVTPFLKGLPNDHDPCPHWGILLKGQMRVIFDGKEEIVKAGEAYYMPPGHTAIVEAGTEGWEFSPNDKMQKTMEVAMRNFKALQKK
jgi:mannose-6-phosphate isomerase-like protein (cupin superfamily)